MKACLSHNWHILEEERMCENRKTKAECANRGLSQTNQAVVQVPVNKKVGRKQTKMPIKERFQIAYQMMNKSHF